MFNLIKYDFKRRLTFYGAFLVSVIFLNVMAFYLWGVMAVAPFFFVAPFVMPWVYIGEATKSFNEDLNGKSRYMVFMTPHSGHTIIRAKLVRCLIFGLGLIATYVAFAAINGYFLYQDTETYRHAFPDVTEAVGKFIDKYGYSVAAYYVLAASVYTVTFTLTIFMALTFSKSLLSESKYRWIIALATFLLLVYAGSNSIAYIIKATDNHLANYAFYVNASVPDRTMMMTTPPMILAIIYSIVILWVSGYLLEKKINL